MVGPELLEIPVIPATLVTVGPLVGGGGVVGVGMRLGDGEELCCRLGGRLFVGALTRCLVILESGSEVSTNCI